MIIKSEQIANRVEEIIASRSSILKPNPTFSDNELKNIKNFLIEAHKNPLIEDKNSLIRSIYQITLHIKQKQK